jgi:hypothetical protein
VHRDVVRLDAPFRTFCGSSLLCVQLTLPPVTAPAHSGTAVW